MMPDESRKEKHALGAHVTYVDSVDCEDLRVVLCIEFDRRASPAEITALKSALIATPATLHSVESAGSFDFLVELAPPDLASFNKMMKAFGAQLAKLATRCETSFVCKRYIRRSEDERALWLRNDNGLQRLDMHSIDKIAADGDYVQVFSSGRKWLLHATMHALRSKLNGRDFVQLNRSLIARRGFIERLSHQGRTWMAHLRDGSVERISRSHTAEVLEEIRSPSDLRESSNLIHFGEPPGPRLAKI